MKKRENFYIILVKTYNQQYKTMQTLIWNLKKICYCETDVKMIHPLMLFLH